MNLAWGVSGLHRWRYTKVGLDYRGSLAHFAKRSYYDSLNQSIMLGVTHQLTRHTTLSLRESAGIFSRDYGLRGFVRPFPLTRRPAIFP